MGVDVPQGFVLFNFTAESSNELHVTLGQLVHVLTPNLTQEQEWWYCALVEPSSSHSSNPKRGYVPRTHIQLLPSASPCPLQRQRQENEEQRQQQQQHQQLQQQQSSNTPLPPRRTSLARPRQQTTQTSTTTTNGVSFVQPSIGDPFADLSAHVKRSIATETLSIKYAAPRLNSSTPSVTWNGQASAYTNASSASSTRHAISRPPRETIDSSKISHNQPPREIINSNKKELPNAQEIGMKVSMIIKELLATEAGYLDSLAVLGEHVVRKLQVRDTPWKRELLEIPEVAVLLSYIEQLWLVGKQFYRELLDGAAAPKPEATATTTAAAASHEQLSDARKHVPGENTSETELLFSRIEAVARILGDFAVLFKLYAQYASIHTRAANSLADMRKESAELSNLLESVRTEPRARNQDVSSLLIMPIQRIPRYELFARELGKVAEKMAGKAANNVLLNQNGSEDCKPIGQHGRMLSVIRALHEAVEQVRHANRHVNESVRISDEKEKLLSLQDRFTVPVDLISGAVVGRRIVRQGRLVKIHKGSTRPERLLFVLLSDALLYAEEVGGNSSDELVGGTELLSSVVNKSKFKLRFRQAFDLSVCRLESVGLSGDGCKGGMDGFVDQEESGSDIDDICDLNNNHRSDNDNNNANIINNSINNNNDNNNNDNITSNTSNNNSNHNDNMNESAVPKNTTVSPSKIPNANKPINDNKKDSSNNNNNSNWLPHMDIGFCIKCPNMSLSAFASDKTERDAWVADIYTCIQALRQPSISRSPTLSSKRKSMSFRDVQQKQSLTMSKRMSMPTTSSSSYSVTPESPPIVPPRRAVPPTRPSRIQDYSHNNNNNLQRPTRSTITQQLKPEHALYNARLECVQMIVAAEATYVRELGLLVDVFVERLIYASQGANVRQLQQVVSSDSTRFPSKNRPISNGSIDNHISETPGSGDTLSSSFINNTVHISVQAPSRKRLSLSSVKSPTFSSSFNADKHSSSSSGTNWSHAHLTKSIGLSSDARKLTQNAEVMVALYCIKQLQVLHEGLLLRLEDALEGANITTSTTHSYHRRQLLVAPVFHRFAPLLQLYKTFQAHYNSLWATVNNDALAPVRTEWDIDTRRKKPVQYYFKLPTNQLLQYDLMLQKLLEVTPPSHHDHAGLVQSLADIRASLQQVERAAKDHGNTKHLLRLQDALTARRTLGRAVAPSDLRNPRKPPRITDSACIGKKQRVSTFRRRGFLGWRMTRGGGVVGEKKKSKGPSELYKGNENDNSGVVEPDRGGGKQQQGNEEQQELVLRCANGVPMLVNDSRRFVMEVDVVKVGRQGVLRPLAMWVFDDCIVLARPLHPHKKTKKKKENKVTKHTGSTGNNNRAGCIGYSQADGGEVFHEVTRKHRFVRLLWMHCVVIVERAGNPAGCMAGCMAAIPAHDSLANDNSTFDSTTTTKTTIATRASISTQEVERSGEQAIDVHPYFDFNQVAIKLLSPWHSVVLLMPDVKDKQRVMHMCSTLGAQVVTLPAINNLANNNNNNNNNNKSMNGASLLLEPRLTRDGHMLAPVLFPRKFANSCMLCKRRFHAHRGWVHCGKCGRISCHACVSWIKVERVRGQGERQIRVCSRKDAGCCLET